MTESANTTFPSCELRGGDVISVIGSPYVSSGIRRKSFGTVTPSGTTHRRRRRNLGSSPADESLSSMGIYSSSYYGSKSSSIMGNDPNFGRIVHTFVDSTGCHILLSARNGEARGVLFTFDVEEGEEKLVGFGPNEGWQKVHLRRIGGYHLLHRASSRWYCR